MSFGERLQALRRSNDLTQEDFAQQLKVTRQAVSKWESSRGYPEIEKIIYICNYYGVTMDELFADEVPIRGRAQETEAPEPKPSAISSPTCLPAISSCSASARRWCWSCCSSCSASPQRKENQIK